LNLKGFGSKKEKVIERFCMNKKLEKEVNRSLITFVEGQGSV
jgi:hypothetical protein